MVKMTDTFDSSKTLPNLVDMEEVGERFAKDFSVFLDAKKKKAVVELLQEEFPALADNESFVSRVMNKLEGNIVDEKQFVFLVLNPKFKK